jgi:hypothetical protein
MEIAEPSTGAILGTSTSPLLEEGAGSDGLLIVMKPGSSLGETGGELLAERGEEAATPQHGQSAVSAADGAFDSPSRKPSLVSKDAKSEELVWWYGAAAAFDVENPKFAFTPRDWDWWKTHAGARVTKAAKIGGVADDADAAAMAQLKELLAVFEQSQVEKLAGGRSRKKVVRE